MALGEPPASGGAAPTALAKLCLALPRGTQAVICLAAIPVPGQGVGPIRGSRYWLRQLLPPA